MSVWLFLSYAATNTLRLLGGLWLAGRPGGGAGRRGLLLAVPAGCLFAALQGAGVPAAGVLAAETLLLAGLAWRRLRRAPELCLLFAFLCELGTGLWEFLASAGLAILFGSRRFLESGCPEAAAGPWLVRLGAAVGAVWLLRRPGRAGLERAAAALAVLGLFGAVTLSEQTVLPLDEDQVGTWVLLAMVLLFALLAVRLRGQREMEAQIARLRQEQAEIWERDYRTLRRTYADQAKLYHDLHNHIEAIYHCLVEGQVAQAVQYCEDLRTPVRNMARTVWTGDTAIDCLINSKLALAGQNRIETRVNIECPRNTDIRSMDLTTILGNLLDNALEAAENAPPDRRFLHLTIRRIGEMLVIKVENGYGTPPVRAGEGLQTAKADKTLHGWGLKSVASAAERYEGTVTTDYADGVFRAVVTLFFRPVAAGQGAAGKAPSP